MGTVVRRRLVVGIVRTELLAKARQSMDFYLIVGMGFVVGNAPVKRKLILDKKMTNCSFVYCAIQYRSEILTFKSSLIFWIIGYSDFKHVLKKNPKNISDYS